MKILSVLLTVGLSVAALAQTKPTPIGIVPANLYQELERKATAEPNIKPAALAKYANDLLAN